MEPKVIEVNAAELWRDTFKSPYKGNLGPMHLATVRLLLENLETPATELPLYDYMTSPEYRALPGRSPFIGREIEYLEKYRQVFKSIKSEGYVQQPKPDSTNPTSRLGLIPVRIKADGTICFEDGARRLTAILVLGEQERIPVEVVAVPHSFRAIEELLLGLEGKKYTYHPLYDRTSALYHPYFEDWKAWRTDTPGRFRAILSKLGDAKTVLDIGPAEGYFSTNLAAEGYEVTTVEAHPNRAKVLKFFANLRGLDFPVIVEDWRGYCARTEKEFDATIFLSTFHHQVIHGGLVEFEKLGLIRAKKLFFEMATNRDPRMGMFPTLNSEEIARRVVENTRFTHFEEIFASQHEWRTGIFMFW